MDIHFGMNKYTIVPNSFIQEFGDSIEIQILANNVDLIELENILLNKNNTSSIVISENGRNIQTFEGWTRLAKLRKEYNISYWLETVEQIITPAAIDSATGNIITPEEKEFKSVDHRSDIIYIELRQPGLEDQIAINSARIDFLAIMNDLEL